METSVLATVKFSCFNDSMHVYVEGNGSGSFDSARCFTWKCFFLSLQPSSTYFLKVPFLPTVVAKGILELALGSFVRTVPTPVAGKRVTLWL